ncbi:MAG TPA: NUDIX domain-containing protein [Candidatus Saccharimonadales bacterium]|nr:NUDIX domain-containing protein [Candidatus Saccharimonadales bacterium]
MTDEERVWVVAREHLFGRDGRAGWRGVRTDGIDQLLDVVRRDGSFELRAAMESDPSWKQIIPYLVLRDGERYFLMRRTRAGSDRRLHDRYSIGVGGHLNPEDADLEAGLRREWSEELDAGFEPSFRLVGLLNDDDTDVGAVHLGVVYEAEARGRPVDVRESLKLSGCFADPAEVFRVRERMETWSQLVFDVLENRTGVR